MATETLQRELIGLKDDDIDQLLEFIQFLKYRHMKEKPSERPHKRKMGVLADDFIFISPDFDETPDGMEDYL